MRHTSVRLAALPLLLVAACSDDLTAPRARTAPADAEALAPSATPSFSTTSFTVNEPVLPRELPTIGDVVATGRTYRVSTATGLRDAIRAAMPGDEILLKAGVSYVGFFTLPAKASTSTSWITIRTELPAGVLPAPGVRATPANGAQFAKIVAQGRNDPAITVPSGSRNWRLVGLEVVPHDTIKNLTTLVRLGSPGETSLANMAGNIVLDRVIVHGRPNMGLTRCIELNTSRTWIVNSTIEECHKDGMDAVAIGGWTGTGPYRIENNSISGSGMAIFFGGNSPKIEGLIPSDMVIRKNRLWRPAAWKDLYTIKNLIEYKNGKRVLIEGNVLENNWVDGQTGAAVLLKSVNQGGVPWAQTADITFRHNIIRNSPGGVNIGTAQGSPLPLPPARIKFENNLFDRIGSYNGTTSGRMVSMTGPIFDIQYVNNTMIHNSPATHAIIQGMTSAGGGQRFVFRNNVGTLGSWGWFTSGSGQGTQGMNAMWGSTWSAPGNLVIGRLGSTYPTGTKVYATLGDVGFASPSTGDYTIVTTSALSTSSTTTTQPGVNMSVLTTATTTALTGK